MRPGGPGFAHNHPPDQFAGISALRVRETGIFLDRHSTRSCRGIIRASRLKGSSRSRFHEIPLYARCANPLSVSTKKFSQKQEKTIRKRGRPDPVCPLETLDAVLPVRAPASCERFATARRLFAWCDTPKAPLKPATDILRRPCRQGAPDAAGPATNQ